ncbi:MAG: adenylosuccinate synthetase [archaeon]
MTDAYVVVGLGFGDEGKGSVVDYLAAEHSAGCVVRYNGGPQAAHHVMHEGKVHCFSQFGSGTFAGSKTHLSQYMLVEPFALLVEEEALRTFKIPFDLPSLHSDCAIITPFQKLAGRMRELLHRYSSCGLGVGEAVKDKANGIVLHAKDLFDEALLRHQLTYIRQVKLDQAEQLLEEKNTLAVATELNKTYASMRTLSLDELTRQYQAFAARATLCDAIPDDTLIFEGAQGVLLDRTHGFPPFVTKMTTTADLAKRLSTKEQIRIGVLRAYLTRHGNGPFPTEDATLGECIPDLHNGTHPWQGTFRIGWPDLVLFRYAQQLAKVDVLALTNIDRLPEKIRVCNAYVYSGKESLAGYMEGEKQGGSMIIHTLLPQPETRRQEQLTKLLFQCEPVYTSLSVDDYLAQLDQLCPISIISTGPERKDKCRYA